MWKLAICLFFALSASVTSASNVQQTIVGGNATTIDKYPFMVVLLHKFGGSLYIQYCGGSILTSTAILTAAHCPYDDIADNWQARAGSTFSSSGGSLYKISSFTIHPKFNRLTLDSDVSIMRPSKAIEFGDVVKPATIATPSYFVPDDTMVWAAGWGVTESQVMSDVLRHVRYPIVNHELCVRLYAVSNITVTENMICAGDIVHGGKDQCYADSGGPLIYNGTVIGIASGGKGCGDAKYPGIDAKLSNFYDWIQSQL